MDALLFLTFAGIAVLCAINLILQTHPISSALSLVGVMGSLAVLYLLLGGAFIAADVGGTNARVAAVRTDADGGVELLSWQRYPCDDYPDLAAILARFLADHPAHAGVDCMVIASAGVVLGDEVINSNLPWRISLSGLRQRLALRELHVVNDIEAAAHGTA